MDTDEVATRLYEHILQPWFDIDKAAEALEVEVPVNREPDVLPDMDEITEIARYLVEEEEMDPEAEDFELATILQIGLFIHGYIHRNDPL